MKIGKIQVHLKARSHAHLNHVAALLPLAIISLRPHRAVADCGQFVKESWLTRPINWEAPTVPLLSNRRPEESSEW